MNMSLDLESRCKHENKKEKSKYLIYNENTKLLEVKADTKSKFQTSRHAGQHALLTSYLPSGTNNA